MDFGKEGSSRGRDRHFEVKCSPREEMERLAVKVMSNAHFAALLRAPLIRELRRAEDMGDGLSHYFVGRAYGE